MHSEARTNTALSGCLVFAVGATLGIVNQQWVAAGVVAVIGVLIVLGAALWKAK
jgi:hypothetical protein